MAKGKDKRIPKKARGGPHTPHTKTPRVDIQPESFLQKNPAWHVQQMDWDGPFGWESLAGQDGVKEILDKLSLYETMKWQEIIGDKSHPVAIKDLCNEAQTRLERKNLADIDSLVSLRCGAKQRVWGIRHGHVMRLLWWDPEHRVCPIARYREPSERR